METLRLFIADDEPRICTLIKNLIHWDQLPLQLIGTFYDGESCLREIKAQQPNIVISDIRMPGLNGLEMMQACKAAGLATRFIVISGFTQFDYAYNAIKYGVEDFLLKPIGEQELNESLQRLTERMLRDGQEEALAAVQKNAHNAYEYAFLSSLSKSELAAADCTPENVSALFGLSFPKEKWIVGRIYLNKNGAASSYLHHLQELFSQKLHSALQEICPKVIDLPYNDQLLFILNCEETKRTLALRKLQSTLENLQEAIQPYPFMRVSMSVVRDVSTLTALPDALALSETLCNCRFLLDIWRVIDDSMITLPLHDLPPYPQAFKHEMMENLKTLDPIQGKELVRNLFHKGMPNTHAYPYLLWDHTIQLGAIMLACLDTIVSLEKGYAYEMDRMRISLQSAINKDGLLNTLLDFFSDLLARIQCTYQSSESKIIQAVKNYIQEHYSERLGLEDIARQVYLNPTYLGSFFKRETKMNFSDYLTNVRIEEAKRMLEDIEYNVNEIAGKVGFKDANYFSRLFQKTVGIKPTEYRKLRHKQRIFR